METTSKPNKSFSSEDPDPSDLSPTSSPHEDNTFQVPTSTASSILKGKPPTDTTKKPEPKIVLNVTDTRYEVVRYVGKKLLGFRLSFDPEVDWDVFWTDNAVQPEILSRMQPYQKINHFPGMYSLARKNHLARNLMRMKKAFPAQYKFFPQTYLLPSEYNEFKMQFSNKQASKTFILKPEASCQGRGIFLTKTWESVQLGEHYVAQRYLEKPFLLEGLKFDLRIYVLVAGCDPLRIYLYDDGLARFATEEYDVPTTENMDNMCVHLTNYAINKDNPNFVFNKSADDDNVGHKRSLKALFKMLEEKGHNIKGLWSDIKKIIIKTLCSVQPILAHSYKSCQPDEPYNNMCFEILGFDIMLDHKLKPWLLEVNHTPSFTTDTPLDKTVKTNVIRDALKLMNISIANRIKCKTKKKAELQQRVLKGKRVKATPEEKQEILQKAQEERDKWEARNTGSYEKIYPFDDPSQAEEDYEEFIKQAQYVWEQWTGTAIKDKIKKAPIITDNSKLPIGAMPTPAQNGNGSMPNQNIRAKEIQSVYSQKIKVGHNVVKAPPSQKNKKTNETPANAKQNPMTGIKDESISKQEAIQRTDSAFSYKLNDGLQPWMSDENGSDSLIYQEIHGEDEKDETEDIIHLPTRRGNILNKNNPTSPLSKGPLLLNTKSPERVSSENGMKLESASSSLRMNSVVGSDPGTALTKFGTFRIRKAPEMTPTNDSYRKLTPNRETSKPVFKKKRDLTADQASKPSTAAAILITNAPEKLAGIYGNNDRLQKRLAKPPKPVLKLGTGVIGEFQTVEPKESNRVGVKIERKVKSTAYLEIEKPNTAGGEYYLMAQKEKDAEILSLQSLQQKYYNSNQNLLGRKILDTNPQTSKRGQVRTLSRGQYQVVPRSKTKRELNYSAENTIDNSQDQQANLQT